ncbi:MAG: protein kinase [Pyrinomonadaceae bacterium]|nr:protein kinase [Pyrinomonadaceae bacterium]
MNKSDGLEGDVISRYRVLSRIGAGGMGEVYLAQDTTLERTVALKILPADVAASEQRMGRFIQEAKTASALNHPNIITIYEIGQADSILFIATEFIEGETLRERLQETSLTILEALDLAIQIASALVAAHQAGIVHRDIKPENIMLRRDGILKVLDFGLAKLTGAWRPEVNSEAATMVETVPGTILGTVVYMSPEQTRGKEVDERTDIWSSGVLLYEMVAGVLPFEQETPSDSIAAILRSEPPPLSTILPDVPAELERIVAKCLMKNRDERYQGVKDLLVDLRRLKKQLEFEMQLESFSSRASGATQVSRASGSHVTRTADGIVQRTNTTQSAYSTSSAEYIVSNIKRHKSFAFIGLALFATAVIAGGFGLYKSLSRTRTPVVSQPMNVTRFTANGKAVHAAISPDGRHVAYVEEEAGQQSVWIGQVAASSQVQIIAPAEVQYRGLSFTRDGEFLYFVAVDKSNSNGALYQLPVLGGVARKMLVDIQSPITLAPDGKQLAFVRYSSPEENALVVANTDGSQQRELAKHSSPDFFSTMAPAWSPDGSLIACVYQNTSGGYYETVVGVRVADGAEVPIATHRWWQAGQIAWLQDGKGLIVLATEEAGSLQQLWHLPYGGGAAKRITNDLNGYVDAGLTADSKTLVSVRSDRLVNIWMANAGDLASARQITSGTERDDGMRGLSWTPDGKIIYRSVAGGNPNVWIMAADGNGQRQLSTNASQNFDPVVSPDGRYIVWAYQRSGNTNLWRMDLDGANSRQLTTGVGEYLPAYSPDGKWILYTAYDPASSFWSIWKISAEGGAPVRMTDKESALPSISPDGKWFACNYQEEPGGAYKIAILPFAGGQPAKMFDIPGSFGRTIHWTADGRDLTYVDTKGGVSNIWLQSLAGGAPRQLTDFKDQRIFGFAWSRDGKQMAFSRGVVNSDVVLIKDFKP